MKKTSVLGDGEEALDVGMVTHLVLCMSLNYTHTSSITCFAHTHACTLGPRPLRPPCGVVWDLQYIHSTDANRRDFTILSLCTSHHFAFSSYLLCPECTILL